MRKALRKTGIFHLKSKHSRAYAARLHLILMEALQAKCRNTAMMRKQVF